MDRRIQKSKQAIMDAFIKLISEMNFEDITINKIADEANVNRGTVYLHFADKYDLLDQCLETHINQILLNCASEEDLDNFVSKSSLLRTFKYLEQNISFYSVMLNNRGIPAFRNRLLTIAQQSLNKQFDIIAFDPSINKDIAVQFLASAIVSSLEWWFTNSKPYPATVMAEQIWMLLTRFRVISPKYD